MITVTPSVIEQGVKLLEAGWSKWCEVACGYEHVALGVCVWSTLNVQYWAWEMLGKYNTQRMRSRSTQLQLVWLGLHSGVFS